MTGVKFCMNCNNLLYPRAANAYRRLLLACRSCDYEQAAQDNSEDLLVYRNELLAVVTEKAGVTDDVELDPTLPRSNKECPRCHGTSAVFFQDQSKRHVTNMRYFFKCMQCLHVYKDPAADEGPAKDRQRRERDLRNQQSANKKPGQKPPQQDKKPPQGALAQVQGQPGAQQEQQVEVVDEPDSDDEY